MSGETLINVGPCCTCKTSFSLPEPLYLAAKNSDSINFYCPYGHAQVFRKGETDLDKMRRRAERAEQNIEHAKQSSAFDAARIAGLERSVSAQKGVVTKIKKRAAAGGMPMLQSNIPKFTPSHGK